MRPWLTALFFIFLLAPPARSAAALQDPALRSPAAGAVLQGQVEIQGNTDVDGFTSSELSFAYHNNPTGTWFILQESQKPVHNGALAVWDTTAITDGDYDLRLLVFTTGAKPQEVQVKGLRVRNYTAAETSTPEPVSAGAPTLTATAAPSLTPVIPTPTLLPANPAVVSEQGLAASLQWGGIAALGLFLALGVGLALRKLIHR